MMTVAACWVIIAIVGFPIGYALLQAFGGRGIARPGDRIVLALWLGLVACEWLAATVALVTAVTPAIFAAVAGVAAVIALTAMRHSVSGFDLHRDVREGLAATPASHAAALAAIVIAAAFVAANLRATPDTGFYHFPAIRWLAEYGAVTGIVHINDRFGFVSNVWAMLAPFDTVLAGRAGGCINGFVLCLVSGQTAFAAVRVLRGDASQGDVFLGVASFCLLLIGLAIGSFSTPSPDPTVAGLTVVIAWRMLAAGERGGPEADMLPLLLACGALSAKLSGLLLVPVAGLYAVWGTNVRRWAAAAAVALILVAPFFATSLIVSGCFAFPASISCLPVSWALPTEAVDNLGRLLTLFTRWDSQPPADAGAWNWIPGWLTAQRFWLNTVVFWPFAISLGGFLWIAARRRVSRGELWVLALIAPSLVLVFAVAPEVRYNAGLFVIPIALFMMRAVVRPRAKLMTHAKAVLAVAAAVALVELGFSSVIELRRSGRVDVVERLLRPTGVPTPAYQTIVSSGLRYNLAITGDCWRTAPPCAPSRLPMIKLRFPARGIAGGFQPEPRS